MADHPTLSAYCVSLFFENTVCLAAIVAGSEAEAVAQVAVQTARQHDKPLVGIGVMPLEAEWMRFALHTLESGEPHKAPVVSLVSESLERVPRCLQHGSAIPCPACAAEYHLRHLMPMEAPDPA